MNHGCLPPPARPVILRDMSIALALVAAAVVVGGGLLVLVVFLASRRPSRPDTLESDYDDGPRRPSP
jgi:hypothetical protein